jgi:hypothetical protein
MSNQTTSALQLSQNSLSTRDLITQSAYHHLPLSSGAATYRDLTRALLILGVSNLAVVEDHRPATIAVTCGPAMLFGEERFGV